MSLSSHSKTDDKRPLPKSVHSSTIQLSDSSEKEAACRLFGLASTIVEGSFYGMSMAKRKKKFISFWKEQHSHIYKQQNNQNLVRFLRQNHDITVIKMLKNDETEVYIKFLILRPF